MNRRTFFTGAAVAAGGAILNRSTPVASASETGTPPTSTGVTSPFMPPSNWKGYRPVVTPNGLTLPWKMVGGVKVYHLVPEPVSHEFAPDILANCWGYNGRV